MTPRAIFCFVVSWTCLCCTPAHAQSRQTPSGMPRTTHDPGLFLFLDDHWIAEQRGLRRVVNQAQPLEEPIILPDDPRTETDCAWGNVIREQDGRFRLWYCTMAMGHNARGPHEMAQAEVWSKRDDYAFRPRSPADVRDVETMLGKYAESDDGLHWKKPRFVLE